MLNELHLIETDLAVDDPIAHLATDVVLGAERLLRLHAEFDAWLVAKERA